MRCVPYIPRLVKFPPDNPNGMLQITELRKLKVNREKKARAQKKKNKPLRSANIAVHNAENLVKLVHRFSGSIEPIKLTFSATRPNRYTKKARLLAGLL